MTQPRRSSKAALALQLAALVESLKPYEVIEIRLNDNKAGSISIIIKSNHKEVVELI